MSDPSNSVDPSVLSFVDNDISSAVGASLIGLTAMVTVAVLESSDPSFTLYVNVSSPL